MHREKENLLNTLKNWNISTWLKKIVWNWISTTKDDIESVLDLSVYEDLFNYSDKLLEWIEREKFDKQKYYEAIYDYFPEYNLW